MKRKTCRFCGAPSEKCFNHGPVCQKHYRILLWIKDSKARRLPFPSFSKLEAMVPSRMQCPTCPVTMTWTRKDGSSRVITIQHNRDGTVVLLCFACNMRHRGFNGDDFYKYAGTSKRCPSCDTVKPFYSFPKSRHRSNGIAPYCNECLPKKQAEWYQRRKHELPHMLIV